ncbi:MAG: helix-hairpin-helix domain-containing protein, partial [Planctomycetota bacterium]
VASNASDPSQTRDRAPPARTPAPVDINAADAATLQTLPGIGPALAGRIVESRAQDGPFRSVEALTRVRGIGPKTLETLRPRLRVVGARSTPPPDSTPPAKPTDATAPAPARSSPVLSQSQGSLVDLNQASAERLDTLPGIGPALAARIIADRKAQGPYPSVDALARVKGIGPKTVAALRDKVRVGGAKPGANQPVSRSPAAAPANSASPINVNAANAEQLQALPGVGPVLSARLIADRRSNGPFKAAADLERVKGIGAKTAARLAPRVWFGPPDGPAYRPTKQAHRSR